MKQWKTKSGYVITRVLGGRCNVYLLSGGGKNILVDTSRRKYRARLTVNLERLGIAALDALVLTHTHFDHAENAAFVRKKYGARVIVHESEAAYLRSGNSPLPRGSVFPTKLMMKLAASRVQSRYAYEPCIPDILVGESYSLSEFGLNARLVHTPGHSRGMMSLIVDGEIAMVGDAMFGIFPWSIFPPFADDTGRLIKSWGVLLETGCRLFLPSHGSPDDRALMEKCLAKRRKNQSGR